MSSEGKHENSKYHLEKVKIVGHVKPTLPCMNIRHTIIPLTESCYCCLAKQGFHFVCIELY